MAAYPNLTVGQRDLLTKALGKTPTNAEYQKIQDRAEKYSERNISRAMAQDRQDEKNATNMMVGSLPDGSQVAGTPEELSTVGATGVTKLPAADQSKVYIARQLISPNGLISNTEKDIAAFKPEELNAISSRWKEFMAGTFGSGDPRYVALRTDTKLLSTALMQAHVGSRGSEGMMEHFGNLADAGKMDADSLKAAISTERRYVTEKAMLPKGEHAVAETSAKAPKVPAGATHTVMGSDGKRHYTDGKNDLGVVQ